MWAVTLIRELGRGGKEASPHLLTPLAALGAAWLRQRAALRDGKQPASVVFAGALTED